MVKLVFVYVIGIDIGGMKIVVGFVDEMGVIFWMFKWLMFVGDFIVIVDDVVVLIREFGDGEEVIVVGIVVVGFVDVI